MAQTGHPGASAHGRARGAPPARAGTGDRVCGAEEGRTGSIPVPGIPIRERQRVMAGREAT